MGEELLSQSVVNRVESGAPAVMDSTAYVRLLDDEGSASTHPGRAAPGSSATVHVTPLSLRTSAPPLTRDPPSKRGWESLDFSRVDSAVHEAWELTRGGWHRRSKNLHRWVLLGAVGAGVGCSAFFIAWASLTLQQLKFSAVDALIVQEQSGVVGHGAAVCAFMTISTAYALLAALPTAFLAPEAAGSGISEVKAVLNGVSLPKVLRLKTLLVKVWGNVMALASGAPIGAEGPMMHVGAILASGMSQGKSSVLGLDTRFSVHPHFRTDLERRDFVAAGAAAGVAAAFGAPVGGVLLLLEETASHWHKSLTWRAFFCAVVAAYTVDFLFTGVGTPNDPPTGINQLDHPGMFSFGAFADNNAKLWSLWELPVFIAIGMGGGLLGALFVSASRRILRYRAAAAPPSKPWRRVAEVLCVVLLNAALKFAAPYFVGQCIPNPTTSPRGEYKPLLVQFYCPDGQHNDLATLFMTPAEEAIRALFHYTHIGGGDAGPSPFSAPRLSVFFVIYSVMATLCNGLSWPSGLFIPSLLSGSVLGRMVGETLNALPGRAGAVDPGTYSLVGAAAMLAGTSRLTICLSAILLESTGAYIFSLPLMVTVLSARLAGQMFNESIYDTVIKEKGWPILAEAAPGQYKHLLRAGDVMARAPTCVPTIIPAGTLLALLQGCSHHGFPVVHTEALLQRHARLGNLAGYIQRRHLAVLLAHRTFHAALPSQPFTADTDVRADVRKGRQAAAYCISVEPRSHGRARSHPTTTAGGVRARGDSSLYSDFRDRDKGRDAQQQNVRLRLPSLPSMSVDALLENAHVRLRAGSTTRGLGDAVDSSGRHSGSGTRLHLLPARAEEEAEDGRRALSTTTTLPPTAPLLASGAGMPRQKRGSSSLLLDALSGDRQGGGGSGRASFGGPDETHVLEEVDGVELAYEDEPLLTWDTLAAHYPRYPDLASLVLTPAEARMYVDLRPYMDMAPVTVSVHAPLERAHVLFRACGLRHLLVTNDGHDVVGIISRQDLTLTSLEDKSEARALRKHAQASAWDAVVAAVSGTTAHVAAVLHLASTPVAAGGPGPTGGGSA